MQNVLGKVSELDQANAQPTTLRLLIAQRLLELFGRDKSPSYQEITQSRQLGSRMRICRYVECSHTNTVAVSADCGEKVNGSKGFRGNLKSDDSCISDPEIPKSQIGPAGGHLAGRARDGDRFGNSQ